jgi:hypothetical protein
MKKHILAAVALAACATFAQAQGASTPAKKELIKRLLQLQQPGIEAMAKSLTEQPAARMLQEAGRAMQAAVPPEKREAVGKQIEASVKKYVAEATPIVRDRAIKLAPSVIGTALDEKFSEEELKQLLAWFESPVNKKYQQLMPEVNNGFTQKVVADARPTIDPKLKALDQSVRDALGLPAAPAASGTPAAKTK